MYYLTLYVACGLGIVSFDQDHCLELCCYINAVALHSVFGLRYLISHQQTLCGKSHYSQVEKSQPAFGKKYFMIIDASDFEIAPKSDSFLV